jgi:cold shock CspA family protein
MLTGTQPHFTDSPGFAAITPEQLFTHFSTIQIRGLQLAPEHRFFESGLAGRPRAPLG